MKCSSCGKGVEAEKFWVNFPCPKCRQGTIIRCAKCKTTENAYTCSACSFKGP